MTDNTKNPVNTISLKADNGVFHEYESITKLVSGSGTADGKNKPILPPAPEVEKPEAKYSEVPNTAPEWQKPKAEVSLPQIKKELPNAEATSAKLPKLGVTSTSLIFMSAGAIVLILSVLTLKKQFKKDDEE